jgi:hypothetical protein
MNPQVLVGLAVTSNNTAALCTAQFDNVQLSSWPNNLGPDVDAGTDQNVTFPSPASLAGTVTDDGEPAPPLVTVGWEKISGPGTVTFTDATRADTTATFALAGSYVLRLRADDGAIKTFNDVTITTAPPSVAVDAISAASEYQLGRGTFRIARTGSTAASLTVRWEVGGTATPDSDYARLGNVVTLGIGESAALIEVVPLADTLSEGVETVALSLEPDSAYLLGAPAAATVSIADLPIDDWRLAHFGVAANNASAAGDSIDGDLDGLPNLLEYALGGNPFAPAGPLTAVTRENDAVVLTYNRPVSAVDLLYSVEQFDNSTGWSTALFSEIVVAEESGLRTIQARVPLNGATEKIIRLRVTRN